MSLISDALKTAQRQRPATPASNEGQPLLEGFLPYVSSTPRESRSSRSRLVIIAAASIAVIAVAAWLSAPVLGRMLGGRGRQDPPILLPPPLVVRTPVGPEQTAVLPVDSQPVASADQGKQTRAPDLSPPAVSASEPRATLADTRAVPLAEPAKMRADSAAAPSRISMPSAISPTIRQPAVDYEAEATALFNAGDLVGARDRFLLATRHSPTARAWTNYGVTLQKLGELPAASAAYEAAIGIDGNYLEAWLYLGRVTIHLGESYKAVPLFERALRINPRHSEVNTELADLQFKAMNWTETRRFAEVAVKADPANARAHYLLAIASDELKDVEVAAREFAAYLQTIGSAGKDDARSMGYAQRRLQELRGKP
jgi:Flp pilus assembly protein TadD